MKRNYIYQLVLIAFMAISSSCSLDKEPLDTYSDVTEGVTDEEETVVFKDRAAVEGHLQTIYNQMRDRQEHWYMDLLLIAESHSDNAYAGTTGAEVMPFENNSIEGSNSVMERDWNRYMEDIARANLLIVNIDSVEDNTLTNSVRNRMKAEAKIFRAMVMFDMVRLWGDIPVVTTIAGDITEETIEDVYEDYFPVQKTEKEAYEQIEKDLLEAISDAPENLTTDKTKFSKSVARALLVKLYAEKPLRNYAKVIQYADELAADGFGLEADYRDLFGVVEGSADAKKRNSKESILEAQFFVGNGNWVTWMFGRDLSNYNSNFTWAKWITPSRDLIAAFTREADQIRYTESIVFYEATWSNYYPSNNYPFMYKTRSAFSNIIKMRYADILLLKAEALIMKESPDLAAAADIIDQVRERVQLPKLASGTKANKENMLEAYLKERRLELAFEGERWFDLVRLNKVEQFMNAVYAKDSGRKTQVYPFNENSYRLPIPQAIIDQNPNIVQNLGY
ncbi:RagB/SusD family nutrient uptake outer membrane protein [Sphingobacterium sp. HJSM2_6]|uniref:RagB/SusD family nutrient uptake outer membrane protein n=1 Tax=Sphingobacterium sp. HJSM2_6 TaxID=3366264 RepID=UPI003BEA07D6